MDLARFIWNLRFRRVGALAPSFDDWLGDYLSRLGEAGVLPVLDLGCGSGNTTRFLVERGHRVVAADYSREALALVARRHPAAETRLLDLREPLPFASGSFGAVVAELSLHYFDAATTMAIVAEIRRVLVPGGSLLCRLNSIHDRAYGAGRGREIEPHYYAWRGERKRFFDEADIHALFGRDWAETLVRETSIGRYGREKRAWELCLSTSGSPARSDPADPRG